MHRGNSAQQKQLDRVNSSAQIAIGPCCQKQKKSKKHRKGKKEIQFLLRVYHHTQYPICDHMSLRFQLVKPVRLFSTSTIVVGTVSVSTVINDRTFQSGYVINTRPVLEAMCKPLLFSERFIRVRVFFLNKFSQKSSESVTELGSTLFVVSLREYCNCGLYFGWC